MCCLVETKKEVKILAWMVAVFAVAVFLPIESARFNTAVAATFDLVKWYAREHVVLCLLPAFFIAGVIAIFVSQGSVLKYFGANAKKWLAYTVGTGCGVPVFWACHQYSGHHFDRQDFGL